MRYPCYASVDLDKDKNEKDLNFIIGDHVRISEYKNIFAKRYVPNWSDEVLMIKKVKYTVLWIYVISDIREEIVGIFYKKELQKINQKEFRIEKVKKKQERQ